VRTLLQNASALFRDAELQTTADFSDWSSVSGHDFSSKLDLFSSSTQCVTEHPAPLCFLFQCAYAALGRNQLERIQKFRSASRNLFPISMASRNQLDKARFTETSHTQQHSIVVTARNSRPSSRLSHLLSPSATLLATLFTSNASRAAFSNASAFALDFGSACNRYTHSQRRLSFSSVSTPSAVRASIARTSQKSRSRLWQTGKFPVRQVISRARKPCRP
jgi:hypothetical protein